MSDRIAKYEERRFDGKRLFELFGDRMLVSGARSLGPRFEQRVELRSLNAIPDRLWTRPPQFWGGIAMAVIFSTISIGFETSLPSYWKALFWVLFAAGALLALATSRRIEWAVFRNLSGLHALDVARIGPDRDHFEEFVDATQQAIIDTSRVSDRASTDT